MAETQLVTTSMDLDKEDVLAIGISQAEEYAQKELDRCRDAADQALKKSAKLFKELEEKLTDLAVAHFKKRTDAAIAFCKANGLKDTKVIPDSCHKQIDKGACYTGVTVLGNCQSKNKDGNFRAAWSESIKVPAAILAIEKQANEERAAGSTLEAEAMEWKKRLTQIPRLERKLRGKLAASRLSQTQEGSDIVSLLSADIRNEVLALPCK